MKAKVVINEGQARFSHPLYLKPNAPMVYYLEVPDENVAPSRDWVPFECKERKEKMANAPVVPQAKSGGLQEQFNHILGHMTTIRKSASIGDDHQVLMDALEERYDAR